MRLNTTQLPLAGLAAGVGVAVILARSAWVDLPLQEPTLLISGTDRCVVDLLTAPGQATAVIRIERPGRPATSEAFDLSGTPRRFLIAERRDGAAVMGWSTSLDGQIETPITFAAHVARVGAAPDPRDARQVTVSASVAMYPGPGRTVLELMIGDRCRTE